MKRSSLPCTGAHIVRSMIIVGWEKSASSKSAFYRETKTWDPLEERELYKSISSNIKELFELEFCCP